MNCKHDIYECGCEKCKEEFDKDYVEYQEKLCKELNKHKDIPGVKCRCNQCYAKDLKKSMEEDGWL